MDEEERGGYRKKRGEETKLQAYTTHRYKLTNTCSYYLAKQKNPKKKKNLNNKRMSVCLFVRMSVCM